jgi:hypothetical protein
MADVSWRVWSAWNTEPTVPSTKDKNRYLDEKLEVGLVNMSYTVRIYDTPLGQRWLRALKDNLREKRILEKNFCFLGFADSQRNLSFLVNELNLYIRQINSFSFSKVYPKIDYFVEGDFQHSDQLPIGYDLPGLSLNHESCNLLHKYFEDLQGTVWELSPYYLEADHDTKYAIRQLNNICHEIEGWVTAYRKKQYAPEWVRPSQITTFLNAPRYDLQDHDYELFKKNRFDRELGGVYLHWSQIGKTLFEVFRDEKGAKLDEVTCSAISHQKFYSGEFDIEWGQSITEDKHDFKKLEMDPFRAWLEENGFSWEDPKLSLGYIKLGQVDLHESFGTDEFLQIYDQLSNNLDISYISTGDLICDFPYTLESDDWKNIQMQSLKRGFDK